LFPLSRETRGSCVLRANRLPSCFTALWAPIRGGGIPGHRSIFCYGGTFVPACLFPGRSFIANCPAEDRTVSSERFEAVPAIEAIATHVKLIGVLPNLPGGATVISDSLSRAWRVSLRRKSAPEPGLALVGDQGGYRPNAFPDSRENGESWPLHAVSDRCLSRRTGLAVNASSFGIHRPGGAASRELEISSTGGVGCGYPLGRTPARTHTPPWGR